MDALLTALADPARWRLVSLLAERPRSVGVLAQLAEARQPQTTKHLQALERAGVVTSQRTGQRRIYALRPAPLRDLAAVLSRLADTADQVAHVAKMAPGGLRFHDLRHSYATELVSRGVPVNDVQTVLGHEKPSTTLNLYTHRSDGRDQRIRDAFADDPLTPNDH
ncbi:metalloregulator ArsR/SmtB family transcription factor [Micromonospora echinofusca]|uniref:metalloregulator ArsR/SmtB family transcription factor n=2 Tax=Micromonospora echinofusca TaxID=47858 RepID=UPI003714C017